MDSETLLKTAVTEYSLLLIPQMQLKTIIKRKTKFDLKKKKMAAFCGSDLFKMF